MKSNPWRQVEVTKRGTYLRDDLPALLRFNDHVGKTSPYFLHLKVHPEPFVGSPKAPVWLLNLNPGFVKKDLDHSTAIRSAQLQNLKLELEGFWFLNPKYSDAPGSKWWANRLKALCDDCGVEAVSKGVFCVEYFPYHSKKFRKIPDRLGGVLESQRYAARLVRAGIDAGKRIIRLRGKQHWKQLVEEMDEAKCEATQNPRCAYLSPNNFKKYSELCNLIRKNTSY